MKTPKIVAYGKGIAPTGGMNNSATVAAKKVGKHTVRDEPPLTGQRYEANGAQPAGTLCPEYDGRRHFSPSMKYPSRP